LFDRIKDKYLGNHEHFDEAQRTFTEWKTIRDEVIALMKAGRREEAADITKGRGALHVAKIQEKMNGLIEFARDKASEFLARADSARDSVTKLMALFLFSALVLGVIVAVVAIGENIRNLNKLRSEIAERKRVENDLEKSRDRLVVANKELESFSYSVSHDLKNPLRNIIEYAGILEGICHQHVNQEGVHIIARIQSSAHGMRDLIDNLLDLSKITRQQLSRSNVDLSAIVTGILEGLREQEPERKAVFKIEREIVIEADEGLISIAIQNLLGNAWKFTRNKETVEIQFRVAGTEGVKTYFIKDNGAGFNPLKAELLFQPFQRLHSQKEFAGTGIGLATVQRIIQLHGGKIWAEGQPEIGATFYFTLGD
jgi:signal transduction histidine kinase